MEHTLFHVLLIFNAFCTAMENPIASTFYRFKVYPVDNCPMNKSAFEEASIKMNCSQDTRYLCAPDRKLSNLIEFCTDVRRSLFGPDNCVRLEGTGNLNHYNCEEFSSGCPSTPYVDDQIYRYPACLSINGDLKCFVADMNCTERICNSTTLEMCLNNSKSGDSISKMKTNTFNTHSHIDKVIVFVVYVFVSIMIGIIGSAFYRRQSKKKGTTEMQIDEEKLKDFLSKGNLTVRHVRCIIMGCSGAGKTTLLRRLQNAKLKDLKNVKRTELVDVHANIFDVSEKENTIQSVHTKNKLPLITFPEQLTNESDQSEFGDDFFIDASLTDDYERMDESKNGETERLKSSNEEQNKSMQVAPRETSLNKEKKPYQILEENKTNNCTNPSLDDSATNAFSKIMDFVKELSSYNHMCPRITFLDFAGQSMNYAFQQIYFSPKSCYILVVDMTKNPNEQVHETNEKCCSLFESWTYKDFYKFWLKLINSYSHTDSRVILVGTHAENLSKEDIEKFFGEFYEIFQHHPYIQRHLDKARTFAIGLPVKGSKLADLKDMKTCIAKYVSFRGHSVQIKPVWALFEHIMQKEKRRRIIPRKTVSDYNDELSKEFRLNDDNITEMLLFLHRVGNLLYFDEGILRETIIVDVQWFVDAFISIIKYREDIAITDQNSSRFKTTGELTDQELTAIWTSDEKGQTYLSHKKEVLLYMEHFGLVAICDAQNEKLPLYYFPSMNKRRFKNQSNHFTKSSILCFQFNKNGQLPFDIFYRLVVKCLEIPEWSILQKHEQNCWYENVACFSYRHCIVVVCLCKFQIQLQVWNPEINGHIEPELLGDIQRSVEEKLSINKYLIGYKCKNGTLNAEEDNSFIAQTKFPVSKLNCPNCTLGNKHHVDNQIFLVLPGPSEYTRTDVRELRTEFYNLLEKESLKLTREVMTATVTRVTGNSVETLLNNLTNQEKGKMLHEEPHRIIDSKAELCIPYALLQLYLDREQSPKSGWGNPVKKTDISIGDDIERLYRIRTIVCGIAIPDYVSVETYIRLFDIMLKALTRLDPNDEFKNDVKAFAKEITCLKVKHTQNDIVKNVEKD